jgi:DNA-binding MarR family transcriptional regulator
MKPLPLPIPLRERIIFMVRFVPGLSAYQIARILEADSSSVSSLCRKLERDGVLRRVKGQGPRKGFAYYLTETVV